MSRITNQNKCIANSPSPITPIINNPPCKCSYEKVEDSSNGSTNTTATAITSQDWTENQLIANTRTSTANKDLSSQMAVIKVHININLTGTLATPSIVKPDKLEEPIKTLIHLLKEVLVERRAALQTGCTCSTTSDLTSFDEEDAYQMLAMMKKAKRQRSPEGPSRTAAEHVSCIPENKLTPKKFQVGKKRRDYVRLGDLNKSD